MKNRTSHEDTKGAKARPRLVEMRAIHLTNLYKHPDAEAFGAEEEDRQALSGSVAECGLLDPLSVVAKDAAADAWWVVDGCGRLDALRAASPGGLVPCMVFDLGDFSVREFALHRNTMQRKVTTGQRVLCYLALSRESKPETVRDTAAKLGCSQADIVAARELIEETEKEDAEAVREVYEDVLAGRTPIRRWNAAMKGRTATKGKPKRPIDYKKLASAAMTSLGTVFKAWTKLRGAVKDEICDELFDLFSGAPDDAREAVGIKNEEKAR